MYLETDRLILRKFTENDFADYCAYNLNDPDRDRMMGRAQLSTVDAVRQNFDWLKDREERGYVLYHKAAQKVVGNLTVYTRGFPQNAHPSLAGKRGFMLSFGISGDYKRQGLMQEAVRAVIDKLFAEEEIDYIGAGHFSYNLASCELQKKLGFTYLFHEDMELFGETVTEVRRILWREDRI